MHDFLCKYPNFPGYNTRTPVVGGGDPSRTYLQHMGLSTPGQDTYHLLVPQC